ncbi:MAG: hypothetical protein NTV89_07135 [Proteobacteria bacterium]|nr:hypothetical protein [Pseudomonadota bacterium]
MKRLMLMAAIVLFLCAGCDNGSNVTIKIKGKVFSLADKSAIRGAIVCAVNKADGTVSDLAVTGDDGTYTVEVTAEREGRNKPINEAWGLNASAKLFMSVPSFIRPSIAVTMDNFIPEDHNYTYSDALTDIGMAAIRETIELFTVSGRLDGGDAGAMVVLEGCSEPPCPYAYTAKQGGFTIFNVPQKTYSAAAYKKGVSYEALSIEVSSDTQNVVLKKKPGNVTGTVSGSVNIVNPGDGDATSIVLVPESLFHETLKKGILVPGLRAPESGDCNIKGAYTITGVPEGSYVVLAAFENDYLVRDPDPNIAGTQIVHFTMPEAGSYERSIDNFKITGSLNIISPGGGETPEGLADLIEVVFTDDSSEDQYKLVLYNMYGDTIWEKTILGQSGGADVTVAYDGPALENGVYYQWNVTSFRKGGPISTSEDLKGIFYVTE